MGEFFQVLKRFVPPYKKYLALNIIFNFLAAFLTLFSFAVVMPILEMLFGIREKGYEYIPLGGIKIGELADVIVNNFYYVTQIAIDSWGPSWTLGALGLLLIFMTALKTGTTYLASYFIIPLRSGVVRD
ncbi:MAG: ABC transporter ATP-binding protein, partial [Paramuribaculum sp.]|nr:ABC transporter ATP-binding protein [Paramuribaculum sp.]